MRRQISASTDYALAVSRQSLPHRLSEAPWPLWVLAVLNLGQPIVLVAVGEVGPLVLVAIPVSAVFLYFLLRGVRVLWQIAIAFQVFGIVGLPFGRSWVATGVLAAVYALELALLLVPITRRYFAAQVATSAGAG